LGKNQRAEDGMQKQLIYLMACGFYGLTVSRLESRSHSYT